MTTYDSDKAMNVLGVAGRLTHRTTKPGRASGLWFMQRWVSEARPITGFAKGAVIRVEIRFDDELGNGHNSFAMTAEIREPKARDIAAGGCLHEDIARVFPELAGLIKWHLFDSSGPMHYVANTVFHAGNRDHNGAVAGQPRAFETVLQFGDNPIKHNPGRGFVNWLQSCVPLHGEPAFDFEILAFQHDNRTGLDHKFGPKYTFGGFADKWHECPFDDEESALEFLYALQHCEPKFIKTPTAFGEGKERDLKAARSTAVWPEATDEELSAEPEALKAALVARLPALVAAFRVDMEAIGFVWSPEEMPAA